MCAVGRVPGINVQSIGSGPAKELGRASQASGEGRNSQDVELNQAVVTLQMGSHSAVGSTPTSKNSNLEATESI